MSGHASSGGLLPTEASIIFLTAGPSSVDDLLRRQLASPLLWEQVLILAEWERSLPWSWRRMRALGAQPPAEVSTALDRISTVTEFRSLMLKERLSQLLALCEGAGIPAILLKGAGLALTAYRRFEERPMGDIDLLVAPGDEDRLWKLALENGWVWDEVALPREHYAEHHHLPPLFDRQKTGAKLEIHTSLNLHGHPFALSFDEALAQSRDVPGRRGVVVLEPAHQILHLAVHFAWAHLGSFGLWRLARDLRAISEGERGSLDWERIREISLRYKAGPAVYWSYRLVELLAGGHDAPAEFLGGLRRRRNAFVEGVVERHMAAHVVSRIVPCPSEKWRRTLWELAMEPGSIGPARPWDEDPMQHAPGFPRRGGLVTRIRSQLLHLGEWQRYLRSVTGMRAGG